MSVTRFGTGSLGPGATTFDQVVQKLATPTSLSGTPNGMRARYEYYDGRRYDADLGTAVGYFPPPGPSMAPHQMDYGSDTAGAQTFEVVFNNNGVVRYNGFNRGAQSQTSPPCHFELGPPTRPLS